MSFIFTQPAPGVLPPGSVSLTELQSISANSIIGNPTNATASSISIDSNLFFIDSSTNRIGIGSNSTPNAKLQIVNSGSQPGLSVYSTSTNNSAILFNQGTTNYTLELNSASSSGFTGASIGGYFARGTLSSRAQTLSQDALLSISASGHTGTAVAGISAAIVLATDQNTTASAYGGQIVFATTPNNSADPLPTPRVYIKNDGKVNITGLTASELIATDSSKNLQSLSVSTYPSLTELSYVKGVTSAIQTQLNAKVNSVSGTAPISSSGGTTPTISISDFGGATALLPGSKGSVPAPAAGDHIKFLRGDAQWATAGVSTVAGDVYKVLASDGTTTTWQYAGLGDGNFSTASLILGRGKPTSSTGTKLTLLGTLAGNSLTTGNASVLIGDIGKSITTGLGNIYIGYEYIDGFPQSGYQPGATTTASVGIGISLRATGSDNVAIGYFATTVSDSVAIGSNVTAGTPGAYGGINHVAIGKNTTIYAGDNCVVLGYGAYSANNNQVVVGAGSSSGGNSATLGPKTGAVNNVVVGTGSGYFRNTGENNTVLGSGSFNSASLTTAANNCVFGQGSATSATTGSRLTILGQAASTALTTQTDIVAAGYQSGKSGASNYDTLLGVETAYAASPTGNGRNVLAGYRAGYNPGFYQTVVGYQAAYQNNQNYCTAVGYEALNNANGIGNVGIAMQSLQNAVGDNNIGIGYQAGLDITGNQSICLGVWAGSRATAGKELYIANTSSRLASNALEKTNSLIYGVFNDTPSSQTLTANAAVTATYGLSVSTAGRGLSIKSGPNAKIGTATFTAQSTVTVNTTAVTANSLIFVTGQDGNDAFCVGNKNPGAGTFDIVHVSGNITATVAWMIVEATP